MMLHVWREVQLLRLFDLPLVLELDSRFFEVYSTRSAWLQGHGGGVEGILDSCRYLFDSTTVSEGVCFVPGTRTKCVTERRTSR